MIHNIASLLTSLLVISSLLTAALGIYAAVFQRATPYARTFALLMASITVYCLGYALEISAETLPRILFWTKIEYLGLTTIPAFLCILALRIAGVERRITSMVAAILFCLSAAIYAVHLTNDFHHLYYRSTSLDVGGPFPVIEIERGPWYYVQVTYVFLSFVFGAVLFVRVWLVSASSARPQAAALFFGSLCPIVLSVLYLAGLTPYGMDMAPFALVVTGLLCAVGLFRYKLLDLVPVALDAVFRDMRDGVVILDREGRVAEFNSRAEAALRSALALRIGDPLREGLASRPDLALRLGGDTGGPCDAILEADGEKRHFDLRQSPVRDARGRDVGRMIVLVDITDRVRLLEEMRVLAMTDELTGLCNRRKFMEHARIEMERARRTLRPVSAVALDLDHFKAVNDDHGHAAGDAVLKRMSAAWKGLLRPIDILGRCGGEEFGILLPDTTLETAVAVAERLREATGREAVDIGGAHIRVTASFGVACSLSDEGASPDGLLSRADEALYAAKADGRDRVRTSAAR